MSIKIIGEMPASSHPEHTAPAGARPENRAVRAMPAPIWAVGHAMLGLIAAAFATWSAWVGHTEHAVEAMIVAALAQSIPAPAAASAWVRWSAALWPFLAFAVAPSVIVVGELRHWLVVLLAILYCAAALARSLRRRERRGPSFTSGIPLVLAAGVVLMPTLLGVQVSVSKTWSVVLTGVVFVAMVLGVLSSSHLPAATWRFVRWQPNLIVLVALAAFAAYLGRNIWVGVGWLPVIYLAMCVVSSVLALVERRLIADRPARHHAPPLGMATLGLALVGVAPIVAVHASIEGTGAQVATLEDLSDRAADASTGEAPAGIFIGFTGPLGPEGLPPPWRIFRNPLVLGGHTSATALPEKDGTWIMRMATNRGSFAIDMNCNPDPNIDWDLAWEWRIEEMPPLGDVREDARADVPLQVGVYFDTKPWDPSKPDLTPDGYSFIYAWDSNAPAETIATRGFTLGTFQYEYKIMVVRTGKPDRNAWFSERRNLREDFVRAYGFEPPPIRGVRVQANSQHTKSKSSGLVRNIWLLPAEEE